MSHDKLILMRFVYKALRGLFVGWERRMGDDMTVVQSGQQENAVGNEIILTLEPWLCPRYVQPERRSLRANPMSPRHVGSSTGCHTYDENDSLRTHSRLERFA